MIPVQDDIELMLITFTILFSLIIGINYFFTFVYKKATKPRK